MGVIATRPEKPVEEFIARWQSAGGPERANYQLFVLEAKKVSRALDWVDA